MKQLYEKLVDDLVSETGFDSDHLQRRVWDYFDRGVAPIDVFDNIVDECLFGKGV